MQSRRRKRSRDQIASDAKTGHLLVELANLREDGISRFRSRWDKYFSRYSNQELLTRRDELQLLWSRQLRLRPQLPRNFTDEDIQNAIGTRITERTRGLYKSSQHTSQPLEELICEHWLSMEHGKGWLVRWEPRLKSITPSPRCLPVVMAVACVKFANRLGVCRNRECPAPYFLLARRDQKHCSDACARPSRRIAKLKWWHAHMGRQAGPKADRPGRA